MRGEIVDWYPYPFVDVSELGYWSLRRAHARFALGAAALLWLGNLRAR